MTEDSTWVVGLLAVATGVNPCRIPGWLVPSSCDHLSSLFLRTTFSNSTVTRPPQQLRHSHRLGVSLGHPATGNIASRWFLHDSELDFALAHFALQPRDLSLFGAKQAAAAQLTMNGMHAPFPGPGAAVWQEHRTPDNRTYYYNTTTKQTQWTKPEEMMTGAEVSPAISAQNLREGGC